MIGKLKGLVDSVYDDHLILDVSGVGYLIFCSAKTIAQTNCGELAEFFIETHVREDHFHLYGFSSLEEKQAFVTLQTVKGVGTKMALALLSTISPEEIQHALNTKDTSTFSAVSGVGNKLAERIITELKDKLISTKTLIVSSSKSLTNSKKPISDDAISALINLGINKIDAQNRVSSILATNEQITINDLIRLALRN